MAYLILLMCLTCIRSVSVFTLNESQVNQWALKFKTDLDSHIDKVLGYSQVQAMLRKYESDLVVIPIKGDETFRKIYTNVNLKYTDLVLAVNKLKSGLEGSLTGQQSDEPEFHNPRGQDYSGQPWDNPGAQGPGGGATAVAGPPILGPGGEPPLMPTGGGPPPPLPGSPEKPLLRCCVQDKARKYEGRFREEVQMKECYENVDETLRKISQSGIENIFKENLVNTLIKWQYFADKAGHYMQYPGNQRMCDDTSPNSTSPLLAEWFVEKMYMERKNLVLLVDNRLTTTAQTQGPRTDRDLIIDAVKETLKTLTPSDKVNIVTISPSSAGSRTPEVCGDKLFVASQGNLDKLAEFASQLPYGTGQAHLKEGLEKVYQLYKSEKLANKAGFTSRTNLVLLLMSGQSSGTGIEGTQLYDMIASQQKLLDNSVQHFVYVVGKSSNVSLTNDLAQIADQNNGKLNTSSGIAAPPWPAIPNLVKAGEPVGKEGVLDIVENREEFPVTVATYFQRLPPQLDSRPTTTIVPVLDKSSGVSIFVASAVYGENKGVPVGVTAVDASLAEIFSDILSIDVGHQSYGFLIDVTHGHVLLHPKLRDGSDDHHDNSLFPRLQLLEPDLTKAQIQAVLQAKESMSTLNASISHGRTTVTGELVKTGGSQKEPVRLYYQLVSGTSLCVVFVHFLSDSEEARLQKPQQKGPLHAPYHRIDELVPAPVGNKPDKDNVCHLYGNFLSFKESVIKLSPWVFKNPVQYKYSQESFSHIHELNKFLINDGPTTIIREDMKMLIQHFVRSTDDLDDLWKEEGKKVTERFLGSTSGVFRLYPGSPLDNTFDHTQTDWYKRSVAFPDVTMYHYGKLSFINHRNVLIVTRALVEQGRLQGVIGMTTTRRLLTSQLVKSVAECYGGDKQCHVVDSSGNLLDTLLSEDMHLSEVYPWLTKMLTRKGRLVVDWCTGFSDGYHKETFTLTQSMTSDLSTSDPCRQMSLKNVNGTNLFILILGNRTQLMCNDRKTEICTSCQTVAPNGPYGLPLPRCQLCLSNLTTQCQCQCYCDTDLDLCEGQFKVNTPNFPMDACFYPVQQNTRPELRPESPGPDSGLEFCPLPCAAIEDIEICAQLGHCKQDASLYPACIWKEGEELKNSNISRFFPTSTAPTPPTPPQPVTKRTGPPTVVSPQTSQVPPVVTNTGTRPTVRGTRSTPKLEQSTQQATTSVKTTRKSGQTTHQPTQNPTSTSSQVSSSVSPGFVTHVSGPPLLSVSTGSQLHPISGASTISSKAAALQSGEPDNEGMSGGAIAGLVIGILVLVIILALIAIKVYNKKFRRPGAETSSKYRARSSLFDSMIFHRATEQVISGPTQSPNVPYEEMQHP